MLDQKVENFDSFTHLRIRKLIDMMHDAVPPEMHPKHIRQLVHQNFRHLERPDDDPEIARRHHPCYVTAHHLILQHFLQQLGTGVVHHAQ